MRTAPPEAILPEDSLGILEQETLIERAERNLADVLTMVPHRGPPVVVQVLEVGLYSPLEAVSVMRHASETAVVVMQSCQGEIQGESFFVMDDNPAKALVRGLLGQERRGPLRPLERSALLEIGNSFTNELSATLFELAQVRSVSGLPRLSNLGALRSSLLRQGQVGSVAVVSLELEQGTRNFTAHVGFATDDLATQKLRRSLALRICPLIDDLVTLASA